MNLNELWMNSDEFWMNLIESGWIWMNLKEFWMNFEWFFNSFHFTFCTANVFHFFFSFFKLFLLLRLSKMPKNFSPRPTLCSGLGKIWYILLGRARQKTVNFFLLKLSFQFNIFPFWTVFFNSNVEGKRFAKVFRPKRIYCLT